MIFPEILYYKAGLDVEINRWFGPVLVERDYGPAKCTEIAGLDERAKTELMKARENAASVVLRGTDAALAGLASVHAGKQMVVLSNGTLIRLVLTAMHGVDHPRVETGKSWSLARASCWILTKTIQDVVQFPCPNGNSRWRRFGVAPMADHQIKLGAINLGGADSGRSSSREPHRGSRTMSCNGT